MESEHKDETQPSAVAPDDSSLQETAPRLVSENQATLETEAPPEPAPEPEPNETLPPAAEAAPSAQLADEAETSQPEPPTQRRGKWWLWALLGILLLALIGAGSAFAGYRSAIDERTAYGATQVAGEVSAQYDLALADIEAGNYELARQRLEYVIRLDPSYPGAADALASVLLEQRTTATPTLAPTPTVSPTPDLRGRDELYSQAQSFLAGADWSSAIDTLLTLRKQYPEFQAVQVDGMLYVALRNRGVSKIASSDLEGGTYDLTLAERFGPLDAEARNWSDWAEMYIRGASFWGIDWAQAVASFAELSATVPNLADASGWTATNRYLDALLGYGDWLAARGEWCLAAEQYATYLSLMANPAVEPTAVYADEQCSGGDGGGEQPEGGPGTTPAPPGQPPTPTPEPTLIAPVTPVTPTPSTPYP